MHGKRKIEGNYRNYTRSREKSCMVALKTLSNGVNFLKEFENHAECRLEGIGLKIYGLTQQTGTNQYLMVFQYANRGDLCSFLESNFENLKWENKLEHLIQISYDLDRIHRAGYFHGDLHGRNILQHYDQYSDQVRSYITDLGLSGNKNDNNSEEKVTGVLQFIAPEVLFGEPVTSASDIYSFGVIMVMMTKGKIPCDYLNDKYCSNKAFRYCFSVIQENPMQSEFAPGTPKCYIEFANQCMDLDPQLRPNAKVICLKLNKWSNILKNSFNNSIRKEFLIADKMPKKLEINTQRISEIKSLLNSAVLTTLSKPIDAIEVPDDS